MLKEGPAWHVVAVRTQQLLLKSGGPTVFAGISCTDTVCHTYHSSWYLQSMKEANPLIPLRKLPSSQ